MSSANTEYYDILTEYVNLQEIQNAIDSSGAGAFRFEEFIWDALSGNIRLDLNTILELAEQTAFSGWNSWITDIFQILGIALIAAVFSNFSFSFKESNVSETAFYVCYLILYGILASTFYGAYEITADAVLHITDFMRILAPSYCIAIVFGTGATTSVVWYEAVLMLITLVENIITIVVLPLIGVHMAVNLAGNISGENVLSKLCELIELLVSWCLKGLVGLMVGVSGIQSIVAPAVDRLNKTTLMKSVGSIPGIGNMITGVNETLLSAGILLKDAFGTGGVIAIFAVSMIPIIRLAIYTMVYKLEAAVIQPVSDRRIVACISTASKSCELMLKAVFTSCMLFVIAIALVTYTTL